MIEFKLRDIVLFIFIFIIILIFSLNQPKEEVKEECISNLEYTCVTRKEFDDFFVDEIEEYYKSDIFYYKNKKDKNYSMDPEIRIIFTEEMTKDEYEKEARIVIEKIKELSLKVRISDKDKDNFNTNRIVVRFYVDKEVMLSLKKKNKWKEVYSNTSYPYMVGTIYLKRENEQDFKEEDFNITENIIEFEGYID